MASRFSFNRELLIRIFFFSAFAFLLYQLFLLARPFLTAILVATMLVITFYPLHVRVRATVKKPNLSAMILTVCVVLAAVLPLIGLSWFVFHESDRLIPTAQKVMESLQSGEFLSFRGHLPDFAQSALDKTSHFLESFSVHPKAIILDNIQEIGGRIAEWGTLVARNLLFSFFKIVVLVVSLFFIFRDGENFLRWGLNLVPMEQGHKQDLAVSAYETFRAVTTGVFLTAAAQGATAMIGFLIAGVRLPFLLGVATFMVSLLGFSSLLTVPVALFALRESTGWGVFLLIWGVVLVGMIDNVLKPVLIGSRARMPFFLVFFSILGGLKMYGLLGFILGPMLVALVLTFVKIYREAYADDRNAEAPQ